MTSIGMKPTMVWENDIAIMNAINEDHSPLQYQLKMVNSVHLWIRVITVSNMTYIEGRYIETWARGGIMRRESSLTWPRQI